MLKRASIALFVLLFAGLAVVDVAEAQFRRRRGYTYYNYNNYYYSPGYSQIAAKGGSSEYPFTQVYCDYDRAKLANYAYADKVQVFLHVWDQDILNSDEDLVAEVKIVDLSNSADSQVRYVPVTLKEQAEMNPAEYKLASFELSNEGSDKPIIEPAKVYQMHISLHRAAQKYGDKTAWGKVAGPYYVATSGDSLTDKARQRIAMTTFREWYYTERGWYRNAQYPMDCHAYYCWATGPSTVHAPYGWSNPDTLFGVFHGGGDIPGLMEEGPIHGDYVRIPGHTFMLLAYDQELGQVWTMEGNYGATIEICLRSVGSGWSVGHLADHHIQSDQFQVAATNQDDDMVARANAAAEAESDGVMMQ